MVNMPFNVVTAKSIPSRALLSSNNTTTSYNRGFAIQETVNIEAAENIASGDLVGVKSGLLYKLSNSDLTIKFIGVSQSDVGDGEIVEVKTKGVATTDTTLTSDIVYSNNNLVSSTYTNLIRPIGIRLSSNTYLIDAKEVYKII